MSLNHYEHVYKVSSRPDIYFIENEKKDPGFKFSSQFSWYTE